MQKLTRDRGYQAFRILQTAFVIVPIVAGLDKFIYYLADWSGYLAPFLSRMLNRQDDAFMMGVGVIEIVAGLGVLFKPKIFSYVVFYWLIVVIINLLIAGDFFDIALTDFGMALAALALGKMSLKYSGHAK